MPEGMLGGILGEEDEKSEVEARETLAASDAFAVAVAARLAGNDPGVARKTENFLDKQAQLLEIQAGHLRDEHEARLHFLKGQAHEVDIRRFGLRLRVGFQVFIAIIATGIGLGGVIMLHDAVDSRSVVIEPFDAPAGMADRGITGKVVAAGMLDELSRMQALTRTDVDVRDVHDAWSHEIAIDVPEIGLSVGQLQRLLRERLGHDTHISGHLIQTGAGGLALTVRGTKIVPKTFVDDKSDLDNLLRRAAEYVFSECQPGRFSYYLSFNQRVDEVIPFVKSHMRGATAEDQSYMLTNWGNAIMAAAGEHAAADALPLYRRAARVYPANWRGRYDEMISLITMGEEEQAIRLGEVFLKPGGKPADNLPVDAWCQYYNLINDLPGARAAYLHALDTSENGGIADYASSIVLALAGVEGWMHDDEDANMHLRMYVPRESSNVDRAAASYARAAVAANGGRLTDAAQEWDAFMALYEDRAVAIDETSAPCFAAPTYELLGQHEKADAALAAPKRVLGVGTFVDCYRFDADVRDLRGDWVGARQAYEAAVKMAPSSPSGYYSWGLALARHGDLEGAGGRFRQANERSPHWADPLKAWGDVLAKEGHIKEALAKYDEALKYAPNWKQLHDARAAVAKQQT